MDLEAHYAHVRAHQNNINRFCQLLAAHLTEVEREYVHKRIVEETHALEKLLKPPKGKSRIVRAMPDGQTCS
jgi:hypothetical protein